MKFSQITDTGTINAGGPRKGLTADGQSGRIDGGGIIGYGFLMNDEDRQMLREIIDYCDSQCEAAYQDMASPCDSPVLAARRKAAYADVARHARMLLIEDGG
jgi:hypothetical protein